MRKYTVADLTAGGAGPVVANLVPGHLVERGGVSIHEPGHRSHPEGRHVHDVPEVFCILQGSGRIEIDGAGADFAAGDVFVVDPGEDHHLVNTGDRPLVLAWLHMIPDVR